MQKLLDGFASSSRAYLTKMWKNDTIHVIVSTDEQGTCRSTKKNLHGFFEWAMGGKILLYEFILFFNQFCILLW